jgi:diacylglycerol kinase
MPAPPPRPAAVGPPDLPPGPATRTKPRRRWREKFRDAFRGLKLGIRGHSSFSVHFFFAALVLAAAIVMRCDRVDWCILLGCIGLVLTAELFNSAVETIFHGLDEASKTRVKPCLDIAAGAVLLASITALLIGSVVFLARLGALLTDGTLAAP